MSTSPLVIEEANLSHAWLIALNRVINHSGTEISPLLLTLTDFNESIDVRKAIDVNLMSHRMDSIDTVSETIFPMSLYEFCDFDRFALYEEYSLNLSRIKKIDSRNSYGTYFERLIDFDGTKQINQLEIIIESMTNGMTRRSKFQASIFDPRRDHVNGQYQRFPCLQHVTFYKSKNGGLIMNSFYALQYLFQRAYGNWLGLINLGKFVANELGTDLEKFNCYVGIEKLDHLTKVKAKRWLSRIERDKSSAFE